MKECHKKWRREGKGSGGDQRTLVHDPFEIPHVLELLERGPFAVQFILDFGLELGPDVWAPGQLEKDAAQQAGGGITPCQQDVEELGADADRIRCGFYQLV